MMQEDNYVPVEVRLSYCDAVNSASQQKRVYATQLLQQYPQLSHATVPNYATYRSNKDYDVPELTFETNYGSSGIAVERPKCSVCFERVCVAG